MPVFSTLVFKLLPLYLNILLGYIAGRKLEASRDTIANIMFYMINPLIVFYGVLHTQLDPSIMTVPLLTYVMSCLICLLFYFLSRKIWTDSSKNIMAFSAGSGMTGYFGVPLAMMIFDSQTEGIYIMALLGVTLYENSLGYFISAKGVCTTRECMLKLVQLPAIYAFAAGLTLNYFQFRSPELLSEFFGHIKGVYVVLGMMIIGLGLNGLKSFKIDVKFISMTFIAKFLVWPLLTFLIIYLDSTFFELYTPSIYNALILLSIVPLAANMVVISSLMKSDPEKAAFTVLISMLFALFYVPLMTILFITHNNG